MFFDIDQIAQKHRPKVIFLENVKNLVSHDKGNTFKIILEKLEALGYYTKFKILNALDFGLPQKRERIIIVGFLDKEQIQKFNFEFEKIDYKLSEILEDEKYIDKSFFASEKIRMKRQMATINKSKFFPSVWHENKSGNISILDYSCALRTGTSYNYLLVNGIRRFTSRELLRLQGFPDTFKIVVSNQEIRRQTGNSVAIPMIRMVAKKIDKILKGDENDKISKTPRFKTTENKRSLSA